MNNFLFYNLFSRGAVHENQHINPAFLIDVNDREQLINEQKKMFEFKNK